MLSPRDSGAEPVAGEPTPKLIRGTKAKLRLAAASLLTLALGGLASPPPGPQAPPSEKIAPMLEAAVERAEPSRFYRAVQTAGRSALDYSVAFDAPEPVGPLTQGDFEVPMPGEPKPEAFGVLLSEREVLTVVTALNGRTETTARLSDGSATGARVLAYEPATGLVLLQLVPPTKLAPAPVAGASVSAGALSVASARSHSTDIVVPAFVGAAGGRHYTVAVADGLLPPGMPIYDLQSEVFALVSEESSRAYPVREALERLRTLASAGNGMPRTIGLCLQTVTPELTELVGEGGVLISDVLEGSPAAEAGLRAGDLLIRVAGASTLTPEAASKAIASLQTGEAAPLTVLRSGKESDFQVRPVETLVSHACSTRAEPLDAMRAAELFSALRLPAASVSRDASVLSVDGAEMSARLLASLRRSPSKSRLVHVQSAGRRLFAVIGRKD
jgi:S1-C subfamily serine protease